MKDERKTEIKVGITILLSLILILWIIGWAKNFSLNANRKFYTVRFPTVSGLEVGDQVTVNGVRKGFVDNITNDKGEVLVKVSLEPDITLKQDARFHVEMLDLMGGKKVEIIPGQAADNLDANTIASGDFAADIPGVMKTVGEMTKDFPDLMESIKSSLKALQSFLNDEQIRSDLKGSLAEMKDMTSRINTLVQQNQSTVSEILKNSNSLVTDSRALLDKNAGTIESALTNFKEISLQTQTLISKIDNLITETKDKNNNLGKILYDDKFFKEANDLLKSLQETMNEIKTQLKNDGVKVKAKVDLF